MFKNGLGKPRKPITLDALIKEICSAKFLFDDNLTIPDSRGQVPFRGTR